MKLISSIFAMTLLVSVTGAFAADKSSAKPKDVKQLKTTKVGKTAPTSAQKSSQIALTGSYIKRNINRRGVVTDGPNPVVVLDNEAIRNSGAADVRQLLVLRGLSH